MQRLFGGSTADKLLRRLDCSVLILHAGETVPDGVRKEDATLGRQLYCRPGGGSATAAPTSSRRTNVGENQNHVDPLAA